LSTSEKGNDYDYHEFLFEENLGKTLHKRPSYEKKTIITINDQIFPKKENA